jgi:hypothetical protein
MAPVGRADRTKFRNQVLNPLLEEGLIEMSRPDKPTSSKQTYRITPLGNLSDRPDNQNVDHDRLTRRRLRGLPGRVAESVTARLRRLHHLACRRDMGLDGIIPVRAQ